jgi:integrase
MVATRIYNLRHSAISLLLNSGADLFAVQRLAGHSDVHLTTQTYAHMQADALRRAMGVLDRFGLDKEGGRGKPCGDNGCLKGNRANSGVS